MSIAPVAAPLTLEPLRAQSSSHSPTKPESSAVDVKGVRHRTSDYGEGRTPWDADIVNFVQPDYPADYRARHLEGTGLFRVTLDVNTGSVTNVAVLKSTGASGLDASAARAIRQWRWQPQRWKEIDVHVIFTMRPRERYRGSARELQRAYAYARQGDRARAVADANLAIRLKPATDFQLWRATDLRLRAEAYRILGRAELAIRDLRESVHVAPKDPEAHYELAWLLATCPEDRFRSSVEAASAARKACEISHWENSWFIDALAAANAEAGDFDKAVKYEKEALNDSSVAPKERGEREKRLALFQQRKSFRDEF